MNALEAPKIDIGEKKILLIDDEVCHESASRHLFILKSGFNIKDVFFTDAFDSAMELLDKHPEISIIIADLRIPKNSEDFSDYNPENPEEEWGQKLIQEIIKKYFKIREIYIVVVSAYTFFSYSNSNEDSPILAFLEKPLNHDLLTKSLEPILVRNLAQTFDYDQLNLDTKSFVLDRTQEIKKLVKRTIEDTIKIGQNLVEVKKKLDHGKWLDWLSSEFNWTNRTANNLMNVAEKFKYETVSNLDISVTALYSLAAPSTTEEIREEVIQRGKQGEKITPETVKTLKQKHLKDKKQKQVNKTLPSASKIDSDSTSLSSPSNPPQIIGVQHDINKNSFWKIGENHRLFCGSPKNPEFIKALPQTIFLAVNLPPNNDPSLVSNIKAKTTFTFHSEDKDMSVNDVLDLVQRGIFCSTAPQDVVVFAYLPDLRLLDLVEKLEVRAYIAEPDLSKCDRLLQIWREREKVSRIKIF